MRTQQTHQPTRQQILDEIGIFRRQIAPAVKWLKAEISAAAHKPGNKDYVDGLKQELHEIERVTVDGEGIIQQASDLALKQALLGILRDPKTGQQREPQAVGWRIILTKLVEQSDL